MDPAIWISGLLIAFAVLLIWLFSGPEPSDPEYPKYGWLARFLRWLRS